MLTSITITSTSPFLPPSAAAKIRSAGRLVWDLRFRPSERKVMRKRRPMPVSQWAEQHRVVTMSKIQGPWKNSVTPHLVGMMDASMYPSVRTIVIMASGQTGKSESVNNCIGYTIDHDPGPVMFVYPDEQTVKENSRDRIIPMIDSSPRLRSYKTAYMDDAASTRIKLQHMVIYFAWATSPSRLANKPIRYMVFDETDKYPDSSGKRETDPISLGEIRTTWFRNNCKTWKISTPTTETAPIAKAFAKDAEVRFDYYAACPACGHLQRMTFDRIRWPKDDTKRGREKHPEPAEIRKQRLARYACIFCGDEWDDSRRDQAVAAGGWYERKIDSSGAVAMGLGLQAYLDDKRPEVIAFHLPSWVPARLSSLSDSAADFIKWLKSGDKNDYKNFMNKHAAEPWQDYTSERDWNVLLRLADDRPAGLVPGGGVVAGLTASVDTQKDGFWYEIRAWGYGMIEESWQIVSGYLTSFEALEQALWVNHYTDDAGKLYHVHMVVMDAMGGTERQTPGPGTRTWEVYDFCRKHRGRVYAFKGEQRMTQPVNISRQPNYPGSKIPIPSGIQLLRADVTLFKNKLAGKLETAPADPGAWHFSAETSEEWAKQMTAEYVGDKGFWEQIPGRANHAWDCSVLNLVAAEVIGIRYWPKNEELLAAHAPKPVKSRAEAEAAMIADHRRGLDGFERPGWLNR